jgi:Sec7-like guanine-nucleotide exchange factor
MVGHPAVADSMLILPSDHPYILAFSLIMLHTDAFNKSNKWKMTKSDYIKNTSLPGIFPEVLDVGGFDWRRIYF